MREIYAIVDVGTYQVRAVVGQPGEPGRVSVLGAASERTQGLDEKGVANIEKFSETLRQVLTRAAQQAALQVSKVWVTLSHASLRGESTQAIITFPQTDHEIQYADLERLRWQAVQRPVPEGFELIHVIPQLYHLDHREGIRDPLGMSGIRLEGQYYLVYAPKALLGMIRRCFERIGVEVEGFVSRALVTAEACLTPEQKSMGAGLLMVGHHHTAVVLYHEGILKHFVILPMGSYWVTQDIREMIRGILPQQAEDLKIKEGIALAAQAPESVLRFRLSTSMEVVEVQMRFLSQIIQARFEEILVYAAKEIEEAGLLEKLHAGLYLSGGGVQMRYFPSLVEYVLGQRAFYVDTKALLGPGLRREIHEPAWAGAVSLLALLPTLKEYLPPLPPEASTERKKAREKNKEKSLFVEKIRSLLSETFKIPKELIE